MGGKGGDRKSYKATSSAKAAEALAAKGGAAGFGGFSGIRPVAGFGFGAPAAAAPAAAGPSSSDPLELSAQLDGDLAQCLRHMSKRDTTTKMKALQNLKELIPQKTSADLALLLQPWAYQFKKLLLDPSKSVRAEAAGIMAAVGSCVGKALLPQLKTLLGPWYLAGFDPYPDAAAAAKRSLLAVFPGKKQADVLVYCRSEVLGHITSCLTCTPQTLGDPRKDTPEEMEERHERISAASLAAAAALLTMLQQQEQQGSADAAPADPTAAGSSTPAQQQQDAIAAAAAALQEVHEKLQELLHTPGFFNKQLGSKSVLVRRAGYGFVGALAAAAPQLLTECQAAAAPVVLGALQDKEAANHSAMWDMLLSYINTQQPACWEAVNMQKAFIPRLLAFLRHGCYGSTPSSLPALLPLLALLPRQLLGLQPVLLLDQVLEAVWAGLQHCVSSQAGRAATAAAYQETLGWGLTNAAALASGSSTGSVGAEEQEDAAAQYCQQLLQQGHFSSLLDLAVGGTGGDAQLAAGVVQEVLLQQCSTGSSSSSSGGSAPGSGAATAAFLVQLQVLLAALGAAAQKHLVAAANVYHSSQTTAAASGADASAAAADGAVVCDRLQQLFDALSNSSAPCSQAAAAGLAGSCCAALLPLLQAGQQLPAAASQLVARLIREYPTAACAGAAAEEQTSGTAAAAAGAGSGGSSIAALVRLGISSCSASGQLSAADSDLLLSCIAGSEDAAAAWGGIFAKVQQHAEGPAGNVAGWRFLDALLRRFVSNQNQAAAAQAGWSHPELDGLLQQLAQQLAAAGSSGPVADWLLAGDAAAVGAAVGAKQSSAWGLSRSQAAAASLLGCCLGTNEQQQVLLSSAALDSVLSDVVTCLAAAQAQQHQHVVAAAAAAAVCVAALRMALASSSHTFSSGSAASVWRQQPEKVAQLLLLLAQLSWGGQQELVLPSADEEEAGSSDEDVGSSSNGSSSASSSSSSSSDSEEVGVDQDSEGEAMHTAGDDNMQGGRAVAAAGVSSSPGAWDALQQAAARVWGSDLLSSALDDLPEAAGQQLVVQLQQLLVQGLATGAAAASGDGDGSSSSSLCAAAVEAGLRWGSRAAAVLTGLDGRQQQQQELVQQLLAAVPAWQHWSAAGEDGSSSCRATVSSSCCGVSDPRHALMMMFSSVLLLQVGCKVLLPLSSHANNHSRQGAVAAAASADSSSSGQWLLLVELLCTSTSLKASAAAAAPSCDDAGATALQRLLHCVPAAAAAGQLHLLHTAGKGSGRTSSAAARGVLADTLASLLSATQTAAAAGLSEGSSSVSHVYCSTLAALLQQAVQMVSSRPSSHQQLLPVLQSFTSSKLTAAASKYLQTPAAAGGSSGTSSSSASSSAAPAWVLMQVLEVLAGAFRFIDEACVTAAGLSTLSVGFINKALALPAAAGAVGSTVEQGTGSSSSSSSSDQVQLELELLQLAVACFPVRHEQQHHSHHLHSKPNAAAAAAAAAKGSCQLHLSAGSSTALERQALTALLRHTCSSSAGGSAATGAAAATGTAAELVCRLQLCCVGYCWSDMSAAEWHIVLRDSQQRLTATRREAERAAGSLAGAACTAAQQLTAAVAASNDDVMTPSMAIQVLRRLARKGLLLQRQAGITGQLITAAQTAVEGISLHMLQLGLQLLAAVLQLQPQIQAAGRAPQLDLAVSSAWRELLSLVMALGAGVGIAAGCGSGVSAVLLQSLGAEGPTWQLLKGCLEGCDAEAVGKVLAAADDRLELLGVDSVSSCLALLQVPMMMVTGQQQQRAQGDPQVPAAAAAAAAAAPVSAGRHACEPLQQLAWELLLHPSSLSRITHVAAGKAGDTSGSSEPPEYGVSDDAATYLVQVGLRPEMAVALTSPKPWQAQLLHWALLLAHITQLNTARSVAQRGLTQALRDVPELVPELLERVVGLMGLGGSSRAGGGSSSSSSSRAGEGAAAAAAGDGSEGVGGSADAAGTGSAGSVSAGVLSAAAQAQLSNKLQQLGTGGSGSAAAAGLGATTGQVWDLNTALRSIGLPSGPTAWRLLAAAVYRAVLCTLPASARLWFSDLRDRSRIAAVETYTTRYESPALLAAEFAAIKREAAGSSGEVGGSCSFRVRASPAAREVTAVLEIEDGATLELLVKLPAVAPLKAAEVECRNKVGIKDGRLRKWLLSIAVFLRNQNQGVLDAISMWKANLEQEFAGVSPCLICYSVISAANGQLPRLSCRQCSVVFHPACLYKWFRSSGKSTCPHCQAPW